MREKERTCGECRHFVRHTYRTNASGGQCFLTAGQDASSPIGICAAFDDGSFERVALMFVFEISVGLDIYTVTPTAEHEAAVRRSIMNLERLLKDRGAR